MTAKPIHTAFRIPPDLKKLLEKAAQHDGRSVNQQVIYYIRKGLESEGNNEST